MIQRVGRKHTVILPTGRSSRSQQKERPVNGRKTCLQNRGTRVPQAVKAGVTAIPTRSRRLLESSADTAWRLGAVAEGDTQTYDHRAYCIRGLRKSKTISGDVENAKGWAKCKNRKICKKKLCKKTSVNHRN